jgi:hypothetical protein
VVMRAMIVPPLNQQAEASSASPQPTARKGQLQGPGDELYLRSISSIR